ncbi:MAG: hypothetical protein MJE66_08110 [Proteobacteria bacterium]|nr:hypothetical protein [Pseudomonadota bacterium]
MPRLGPKGTARALGAEVRGPELAKVTAEGAREIECLLWRHRVLFFQPLHAALGAERLRG